MKKLYKSNDDKVFAGVMGGIGEYFDLDSTLLRLAYLVVAILTAIFPAIVVYLVAAIIVPKKPKAHSTHYAHTATSSEKPHTSNEARQDKQEEVKNGEKKEEYKAQKKKETEKSPETESFNL